MKYLSVIMILLLSLNVFAGGAESDCEPTIVTKEVIKTVNKDVYFFTETIVKKDVTRKNRLSLLIGNGPSNSISTSTIPFGTQVRREDENFLGGLYQRDFGRFTIGVFGTTNQSVGGSIGISW